MSEQSIQILKRLNRAFNKRRFYPIFSVDRPEPWASITIDAGGNVSKIYDLLSFLDEENIKVTFFITGKVMSKNPEVIKDIVDRGHEICNHSYSHAKFTELSKDQIEEELRQTECEIEKYMHSTKLFRFPYGETNPIATEFVFSLGYIPIQWNADSIDWDKRKTIDDMLDKTLPRVKKGSIFLFHVQKELATDAMRILLKEFRKQGISNVKISQLILPIEKSMILIDGIQRLIDEN